MATSACPRPCAHPGGREEDRTAHGDPAAVAGGVDARRHRHQRRPVAVAADDVDKLRRIGREPPPAVRLRHLARVALIEAHAGEHDAARRLDARGEAHAVGVGLDLRAGDDEKRDAARRPSSSPATCATSTKLSCGAENTTTSTASIKAAITLLKGPDLRLTDVIGGKLRPGARTSSNRRASGVMLAMWNSATEP